MRPRFYGLDGEPIDLWEWAALREADPQSWVVAKTDPYGDGRTEVSTVWIGLDHNYSEHGPALIFETLVFYADGGTAFMRRYATRAEAEAGHAEVVADLAMPAIEVDQW